MAVCPGNVDLEKGAEMIGRKWAFGRPSDAIGVPGNEGAKGTPAIATYRSKASVSLMRISVEEIDNVLLQ